MLRLDVVLSALLAAAPYACRARQLVDVAGGNKTPKLQLHQAAASASAHPLEHAVAMLAKMKEEASADMQSEAVMYATYSQYVTDETIRLNSTINDLGVQIEAANAEAAKLRAQAESLDLQVNETTTDLEKTKTEKHDIDEENNARITQFLEAETDYRNAIYMIEKAIAHLKAREITDKNEMDIKYAEPPGVVGAALLQQKANILAKMKSSSSSFLSNLANRLKDLVFGPLKQTSWIENQLQLLQEKVSLHAKNFTDTASVLVTLRDLRASFADEVDALVKQESADKLAWQQTSLALGFEIEKLERAIKDATEGAASMRATAGEKAAGAIEDAQTQGDLITTLDELVAQGKSKAAQFTERQATRQNEIAALTDAVSILSKPISLISTKSGQEEHGVRIAKETKKVVSLLQVSTSSTKKTAAKESVQEAESRATSIAFLKEKNSKSNSVLALVQKSLAAQDPLAKVKAMITDLITQMEKEAAEEATHHSWCDTEVKKTEADKEKAGEEVEQYSQKIAEVSATLERLQARVPKIKAKINETMTDIAEQGKIFTDSQNQINKELHEVMEAENALQDALAVLQQVYGATTAGAAPPPNFLQMRKVAVGSIRSQNKNARDAPEIFDDSPYTGQASGGGAVDFLQFLLGEFQKQNSELVAQRSDEQMEHTRIVSEMQALQQKYQSDLGENQATQLTKHGELTGAQSAKQTSAAALAAANAYYAELTPSCIAVTDFDERTKQRQDTIQSLQEAMEILQSQ
ncbi:unnamed protein product [Amoebophrya sp. A120]|nr:unnamed protein product [Amoebophrya sp. A120]|eukprot:GSA120T00003224001.1